MTRAKAIKYALRCGFTAEERKAIRISYDTLPSEKTPGHATLVDSQRIMKALFPLRLVENAKP